MKIIDRTSKIISIWLFSLCCAIICMIFIGGLTRLTDSGLSMTEWHPVTGWLPPMNIEEWKISFLKYKQSPEFIKLNFLLTIEDFKSIYLLEFIHRIAGRITGFIVIIPLCFFIIRGDIKKKEIKFYLLILIIFAMQGFMGWYMVKSGLIANPHVSHFRLAAHLFLAFLLYSLIYWQYMLYSCNIILLSNDVDLFKQKFWCNISIILLILQVILGAFVAGLKAGLVYNNFPLMGEYFIPLELQNMNWSFSLFKDPVFVQFLHRMIAYFLCISIVIYARYIFTLPSRRIIKSIFFVILILIIQITLGIITLIYSVPISFALAHQICAIILLTSLLRSRFLLINSQIK